MLMDVVSLNACSSNPLNFKTNYSTENDNSNKENLICDYFKRPGYNVRSVTSCMDIFRIILNSPVLIMQVTIGTIRGTIILGPTKTIGLQQMLMFINLLVIR